MEEVVFCSFCGRTIDKDFHYCPYCGTTCKDVPSFSSLVEGSMSRVNQYSLNQGIKKLEEMEGVLTQLEADLDVFLSVRST